MGLFLSLTYLPHRSVIMSYWEPRRRPDVTWMRVWMLLDVINPTIPYHTWMLSSLIVVINIRMATRRRRP